MCLIKSNPLPAFAFCRVKASHRQNRVRERKRKTLLLNSMETKRRVPNDIKGDYYVRFGLKRKQVESVPFGDLSLLVSIMSWVSFLI